MWGPYTSSSRRRRERERERETKYLVYTCASTGETHTRAREGKVREGEEGEEHLTKAARFHPHAGFGFDAAVPRGAVISGRRAQKRVHTVAERRVPGGGRPSRTCLEILAPVVAAAEDGRKEEEAAEEGRAGREGTCPRDAGARPVEWEANRGNDAKGARGVRPFGRRGEPACQLRVPPACQLRVGSSAVIDGATPPIRGRRPYATWPSIRC